jgi:hypothetical protein
MSSSLAPVLPAPSSFAQALGGRVPRPLRAAAEAATFADFLAEYAPHTGPVRLGQWSCAGGDRPSSRLGPQPLTYQATLALGERIGTARADACGPVAALTAMLHEWGIAVEVTAFHQSAADGHTATFLRGSDGVRTEWALGYSTDAQDSALRAVVACANRLRA